jgi:two-component system, OmpR family, sensor histidine kinase MprB
MSFRTRLATLCATALAVALAAAILVAYASERSALRHELDSLLRARAAQATPDAVQELLAANHLLPKQRGHGGPAGVGGKATGRTLSAHSTPGAASAGLAELVLVTSHGDQAPESTAAARSVMPVVGAAQAVAGKRARPSFRTLARSNLRVYIFHAAPSVAGLVAAPLTQVDASLSDLRVRFGVITIAALLLVGLFAILIAQQAMRPVAALTSAAENVIHTGDLRSRVQVAGNGHDELSRLAGTINAMLGALERSVGSQRQLVADASHELRTPLTALIANLQLLDEPDGLRADDANQLVARARAEAEGLADLVNDLVELARSSETELHLDDVRLDLIAAAAVQRVAKHASSVTIRQDLSPCTVRGDAELLERAIGNLLDNAAKWSPPSGTVRLTVANGELCVTDEGPGIQDADLPHIFDRFYRSPRARGQPGSGLGLAIVRQTAELHGGNCSAISTNNGAQLRLTLPEATQPKTPTTR